MFHIRSGVAYIQPIRGLYRRIYSLIQPLIHCTTGSDTPKKVPTLLQGDNFYSIPCYKVTEQLQYQTKRTSFEH